MDDESLETRGADLLALVLPIHREMAPDVPDGPWAGSLLAGVVSQLAGAGCAVSGLEHEPETVEATLAAVTAFAGVSAVAVIAAVRTHPELVAMDEEDAYELMLAGVDELVSESEPVDTDPASLLSTVCMTLIISAEAAPQLDAERRGADPATGRELARSLSEDDDLAVSYGDGMLRVAAAAASAAQEVDLILELRDIKRTFDGRFWRL